MLVYKIMSDDDLSNLLLDYDKDDYMEDFKDAKKRIKYFDFQQDTYFNDQYSLYFCALEDNKLIGAARVKIGGKDSCINPGWCNWLTFIAVDPEYQSQGHATKLIDMIMCYCASNDIDLLISEYTEEGASKIHKVMHRYAHKYQTTVKDSDNNYFLGRLN